MKSRGYHPVSRHMALFLVALAVIAGSATSGFSQDAARTVFLQVEQRGTSPMHGNLRDFAEKLLRLRLATLKGFNVGAESAPLCDGPQPVSPNLTQTLTSFYSISASIRSRSAQTPDETQKAEGKTELVLEYELLKYSNCVSSQLVRRSEPFAEPEALTYLDGMANTIALLLEDELQAVKVAVLVNRPEANSEPAQIIADNIMYEIVARLNQSEFYRPRDPAAGTPPQTPADYTINAKLYLKNDRLSVQFFVQAKSEPDRVYPSPTIAQSGFNNQPADVDVRKFNQSASKLAISFLSEVKYASEAGIASTLTPEQLDEMFTKAKAYMCFGKSNCERQSETALPLLLVLRRKMSDSYLVFSLLGSALADVGNHLESAQAWERAAEIAKVKMPEFLGSYLRFAGDEWYQAKNFEKAIDRLEESIKLGSKEGYIYWRLGQSYRFAGLRSMAVDALMRGLEATSDWNLLLVSELSDLAETLEDTDVDVTRLERLRKTLLAHADEVAVSGGVARIEAMLTRLRTPNSR